MSITVTAAQGGGSSTANGLVLRVFVLTQAAGTQNGATASVAKNTTTAFTTSITTTQTGSRVYGACGHANDADTAAALTTVVDDIADATNGERYCTFKATSLTGTPGATTLGVTAGSPDTGPLVLAEIKTAGTLTEDASGTGLVASTTAAITVTTASFAPPAGSLLVALVSSDGGVGVVTMGLSDTSGLTWVEQVKNNPSGGDYAGVWIAQVAAAAPAVAAPRPQPRAYRRPARRGQAGPSGQPAGGTTVTTVNASGPAGRVPPAAVTVCRRGPRQYSAVAGPDRAAAAAGGQHGGTNAFSTVPGTPPRLRPVYYRARQRAVAGRQSRNAGGTTVTTVNASGPSAARPRAPVWRWATRRPASSWRARAGSSQAAAGVLGAVNGPPRLAITLVSVAARAQGHPPRRGQWAGTPPVAVNGAPPLAPGAVTVPSVPRRRAARGTWGGIAGGAAPAVPLVTQLAQQLSWRPRRVPSRGCWAGTRPRAAVAAPGIPVPSPRPAIARRMPARAAWRGTAARTVNAVPATPAAGTVPAHLVTSRRPAARATWRGTAPAAASSAALLSAAPPAIRPQPRRPSARATWRGTAAVAVNAVPPAPPGGTVPAHLVIARRSPARATWRGGAGPVPAAAAGPPGTAPRHPVIARRPAARASWRGGAGPAPAAPAAPAGTAPRHLVIARRPAARGQWHGGTAPGRQPSPATGGITRRRASARGAWRGVTVTTVNAPPPAFTEGILTAATSATSALTAGTAASGTLTATTSTTGGPS